jgi:hypothetical protein
MVYLPTLNLLQSLENIKHKGALYHLISSNGSAPTSSEELNMTEIEKLKKEIEDL